jgi:DNA modification methylase
MPKARLILGDCREVLPAIPAGTVDVVLSDPPYPCIKRSYGYWTEAEWFAMMRRVVPECMRVLKPSGSAVFILQPNSERVGHMRTWLWEFMAWVGKEWGIVQDAWWWNFTMFPTVHPMRPSLKACVWIGSSDCYRDAGAGLWRESDRNIAERMHGRWALRNNPSGAHNNCYRASLAAARRGGVTPFNVLPVPNADSQSSAGANGHGAGTPFALCSWWLRYLCPDGGTVCDPFSGSGTVALAAVKQSKSAIGIEISPEYHAIAQRRLAEAGAADAASLSSGQECS